MGDGVAVIGRIGVGAVRTRVGGNDPIRVSRDVFVEENHFARKLNNPARRADSRHAWLAAVKDLVGLALVVEQVFHFGLQLGLVGRRRGGGQSAFNSVL